MLPGNVSVSLKDGEHITMKLPAVNLTIFLTIFSQQLTAHPFHDSLFHSHYLSWVASSAVFCVIIYFGARQVKNMGQQKKARQRNHGDK